MNSILANEGVSLENASKYRWTCVHETLQTTLGELALSCQASVEFRTLQPPLITWLPPLKPQQPVAGVDRT